MYSFPARSLVYFLWLNELFQTRSDSGALPYCIVCTAQLDSKKQTFCRLLSASKLIRRYMRLRSFPQPFYIFFALVFSDFFYPRVFRLSACRSWLCPPRGVKLYGIYPSS